MSYKNRNGDDAWFIAMMLMGAVMSYFLLRKPESRVVDIRPSELEIRAENVDRDIEKELILDCKGLSYILRYDRVEDKLLLEPYEE